MAMVEAFPYRETRTAQQRLARVYALSMDLLADGIIKSEDILLMAKKTRKEKKLKSGGKNNNHKGKGNGQKPTRNKADNVNRGH